MTLRDIIKFLAGIFRLIRCIPKFVMLSSRVTLWNSDYTLEHDPDGACAATPGYQQELDELQRYIAG